MSASLNWTKFGAVLFDLDGVVTPTAEIHEHAWSELFSEYDFTAEDYLTHVDGKPRYDGVQSFLRSRGVDLPWGDPSDAPGSNTVCAMGNRKNDVFNAVLDRQGIAPYPGTIDVIDLLEQHGVRQAIVSSSKNARKVLDVAGLTHRFRVVVDGATAAAEALPGKPQPDMFLRAAELLDVDPSDAVVVEDASSGAAAGAAGRFGLVLGVDRGANLLALLAAGADIVVEDLADTLRPEQLTRPAHGPSPKDSA